MPITTTAVAPKWLMADVAPGATIYLAWNISVATGSAPDKAPGLAIDDIDITASFSQGSSSYLLIENALKAKTLTVYSPSGDTFGAAPGVGSTLEKVVNGVSYDVWDIAGAIPADVIAVANGEPYGPVAMNSSGDTYLCLSSEGLNVIANLDEYTGWVDPNRPPFVASGIYLRGEVNSWGADSEWELSTEAENTYVL